MSGIIVAEGIGDNKEFSVATTGEILIDFISVLKASNDDPTNRNYYFNTSRSVRKWVLRADQTVEITELNATVLTNPTSVVIGDGTSFPASAVHREEYDQPRLYQMKINILTANTNLKLRIY